MSILKKGKSMILTASLAIAGIVGVGAQDTYAIGETSFSKTVSGYTVSGTTKLTKQTSGSTKFWTNTGRSTENFVTGTLQVKTYLYNAATGASLDYDSNSDGNDGTPRDGKVTSILEYSTTSSIDVSAKSYHSGNTGGNSISGYSYDTWAD